MNSIHSTLAKSVAIGLFVAAWAVPAACQAQQMQAGQSVQAYGRQQFSSGPPPASSGPTMGAATIYRQPFAPSMSGPGGGGSWRGSGFGWPWIPPTAPSGWTDRSYSPPAGAGYGYSQWNESAQMNRQFGDPSLEQGVATAQPPAQGEEFVPDALPSITAGNAVNIPRQVYFSSGSGDNHHHFRGGGYYYPYYGDDDNGNGYLSAYSSYPDFPTTVYAPGTLITVSPQSDSGYVGNYIPFSAPDFNNNDIASLYQYYDLADESPFNYHGPAGPVYPPWATPPVSQPAQQSSTAEPQPEPSASSYPAGSYKAAFADIQLAWNQGDIDPIRKHLNGDSQKISVSLSGKYAYSIVSSNWADITRDAFDHLQTVSFQFTVLRFQKNGDITGYATHVYKDKSGQDETMYVSYALRHRDGEWYIIGVNTSPHPIISEQAPADSGSDNSSSSSSSSDTTDSSGIQVTRSSSGDISISN